MDFSSTIIMCRGGSFLPVREYFYSIQGEGSYTGHAAYFIRLAGCDVGCSWCDSKESWSPSNGVLTDIEELVSCVLASKTPIVIITGGEPAIYPIEPLVDRLKSIGVSVHIETSGTRPLYNGIDRVALSPKRNKLPLESNMPLVDELKVVISDHSDFEFAEIFASKVGSKCRLFLQPQWEESDFTEHIVEYIKENPKWVLSLQTHKYINVR